MVRGGDTPHYIRCGRWCCTTTNFRSYKHPRQSKYSSYIFRQEYTVCRPCAISSVFYERTNCVPLVWRYMLFCDRAEIKASRGPFGVCYIADQVPVMVEVLRTRGCLAVIPVPIQPRCSTHYEDSRTRPTRSLHLSFVLSFRIPKAIHIKPFILLVLFITYSFMFP